MTLKLFTFCVFINRISKNDLIKSLLLLLSSLEKHVKNFELIVYTNFDLNIISKSINIRKYYDNLENKMYNDRWLNLSFNKISIYKDLYYEFKSDYTWIDLDTIIMSDISYINNISNLFIENGGNSNKFGYIFKDNTEFKMPLPRYIQGNFWKMDITLYNNMMKVLKIIKKEKLILRYDVQTLFSYYFFYNLKDLNNIKILGYNYLPNTINGLAVWDKSGHTHANLNGLNNLYYKDNILKSTFYPDKDIHILSFTFFTLRRLWNTEKFKSLFPFNFNN